MKKVVTAQDAFDYMAKVFNKEEAMKLKDKVVLQYNIMGEGGGDFQLILENGEYEIVPGETIQDVTCRMAYENAETLYNLHTGDLSPMKAYTSGKVRFSGSRKVIQKVGKIFPLGKKK